MADAITRQSVEVLTITDPAPNLDPIDVIFMDHEPGKGRIIVRCYSQAWTAWWGSMGPNGKTGEPNTVRSFFLKCDAHYLAGNLIQGPRDTMLARKMEKQEAYLVRIVQAIQANLLIHG